MASTLIKAGRLAATLQSCTQFQQQCCLIGACDLVKVHVPWRKVAGVPLKESGDDGTPGAANLGEYEETDVGGRR